MESSAHDAFASQNSTSDSFDTNPARDAANDASGLADRARGAASAAGERLADAGSAVRDRAGNLKNTLADALESGADKLRQRGSDDARLAGAAAGAVATAVSDGALAQTSNQIAGGMQGAADWLRDADIDGLKSGIEHQVREHPARTLAIAVGLGYLLGKALRK